MALATTGACGDGGGGAGDGRGARDGSSESGGDRPSIDSADGDRAQEGPQDSAPDLPVDRGDDTSPHRCTPPANAVWAPMPTPAGVTSIRGFGPGNVLTAGTSLRRWNGTGWDLFSPQPPFQGGELGGTGITDVWIRTFATDRVVRWDGTAWADLTPPLPTGGRPSGLWVSAPNDAWLSGYVQSPSGDPTTGFLFHWNGVDWADVPTPRPGVAPDVRAFWGSAPNDLWATDGGSTGSSPLFFWHWNGTAWSRVGVDGSPPGDHFVYAIWGSAANDVWAAGANSAGGEMWHFNGIAWTHLPFPTGTSAFHLLWGDCANDFWAVGDHDRRDLWHNDGSGWSQTFEVLGAPGTPIYGIFSMTGNGAADAWMRGSSTILHRQSSRCGDGFLAEGEACDPPHRGPDGLQCDDSCQLLTCGNGMGDPGEQCDPPMTWACDQQCQALPAVCGDGVPQLGESCDMPNGVLCQNCQTTACGACLANHGGNTVCPKLIGAQRRDCGRLLECMAPRLASCTFALMSCYCTSIACANGADGPCAAEMEAVAQTNDRAEVMRQIADDTSLIAAIARDIQHLSGNACYQYCD
jgi:hypothetical protein